MAVFFWNFCGSVFPLLLPCILLSSCLVKNELSLTSLLLTKCFLLIFKRCQYLFMNTKMFWKLKLCEYFKKVNRCCILLCSALMFFFFPPNSFLCLYLLEFPSVIFKMIMCLVWKKLFSELWDQFGCIFFFPLITK